MTESEIIKADIRSYLQQTPLAKILTNNKAQSMLVTLYHQATGRTLDCSGCGNQVKAALVELDKIAKSDKDLDYFKPIPMNYILKEKTRVYVARLGMVVTPHNCTDNNAMAMLGENPDLENRFSKLPKDWKEQSKAYYINMTTPASKRAKVAEPTAKQVEAVTVSEEPPTASTASQTNKEAKALVTPKAEAPKAEVPAPAKVSKPKAKQPGKGKKGKKATK